MKKGFTLIELLVVIAIISMLSAIVLSSVNSARIQARDAKRLADIHQLQVALELYYNDHNGTYPPTYAESTPGGSFSANWSTSTLLSSTYISLNYHMIL